MLPTSGNPFHYSSGPKLTLGQITSRLRLIGTEKDIPAAVKQFWLQDTLYADRRPKVQIVVKHAIRRLAHSKSKPKYDVFYSIEPLIKKAFPQASLPPSCNQEFTDVLILQLRLTTLMRSVDVANVVWGLFVQDDQFFICTTDKNGAALTFSVQGQTLQTLVHYMHAHLSYPAPFLIRHTGEPALCLGSERIAKRLMHIMEEVGIDTSIFKAHSLRGATATH